MSFRCGTVALFGRPNAGKSTLLNNIMGAKLAITSNKPQTTRDRIAGIHTTETYQAIFADTPGFHEAWTELNKAMVSRTDSTLKDADAVLWLIDGPHYAKRFTKDPERGIFDAFDEVVIEKMRKVRAPIILVVNKIDLVPKAHLLPVLDGFAQRVETEAVIPVSALKGDNVPAVLAQVEKLLPEHPALYPDGVWTEHTEKFLTGEIIREHLTKLTSQEIPYATAVEIEQFDESARNRPKKPIVRIFARISVERPSQKGIVIGKRGDMLKQIGAAARPEIEELLGCKVFLELFVSIQKDWTKSKKGLRRVGFEP